MKVMISQPMNGIPDSVVRKTQDYLKEKFAKYDIEVVDSFLTEEPTTELRNPRLFYLGRTIQNFLSDIDAVYFCTGWERAKGCRIERHICEEYGIPILDNSFFKANDRKHYTNIINETVSQKKGKPIYTVINKIRSRRDNSGDPYMVHYVDREVIAKRTIYTVVNKMQLRLNNSGDPYMVLYVDHSDPENGSCIILAEDGTLRKELIKVVGAWELISDSNDEPYIYDLFLKRVFENL